MPSNGSPDRVPGAASGRWPSSSRTRQRPEQLAAVRARGLERLVPGHSPHGHGAADQISFPSKITIFRGPSTRANRHPSGSPRRSTETVYHEIAHHFGISDARLHELIVRLALKSGGDQRASRRSTRGWIRSTQRPYWVPLGCRPSFATSERSWCHTQRDVEGVDECDPSSLVRRSPMTVLGGHDPRRAAGAGRRVRPRRSDGVVRDGDGHDAIGRQGAEQCVKEVDDVGFVGWRAAHPGRRR